MGQCAGASSSDFPRACNSSLSRLPRCTRSSMSTRSIARRPGSRSAPRPALGRRRASRGRRRRRGQNRAVPRAARSSRARRGAPARPGAAGRPGAGRASGPPGRARRPATSRTPRPGRGRRGGGGTDSSDRRSGLDLSNATSSDASRSRISVESHSSRSRSRTAVSRSPATRRASASSPRATYAWPPTHPSSTSAEAHPTIRRARPCGGVRTIRRWKKPRAAQRDRAPPAWPRSCRSDPHAQAIPISAVRTRKASI